MPLSAGSQLGPYKIIAPLGAGGMGEVYRARDERLERDVALKVLPAEVAGDPDRQRRFAVEARAASALNHPNILTVHDVGMESSTPFIIAELVDGVSLEKLLAPGALPVKKTLEIAIQAADGLSAAHEAGIVHRDLKPANLMVSKTGLVKILDFGLAKTAVRAAGAAANDSLTMPGMVVGTASYMSPEQARGEVLDFRSDQFSFGLILYRMLTGQAAFAGKSAMSTIVAIMEQECRPVGELNAAVPAPLRWAVERCLSKDRERRYACTRDLCRELEEILEHLGDLSAALPAAAPRRKRRPWLAAGIAAIALAAGFGAALLLVAPAAGLPDFSSYRITPLETSGEYEGYPAWSSDGKNIAYTAEVNGVRQIFVRTLSSPMSAQITRLASDCDAPFWSPDGTRLFFLAKGKEATSLWSVGASGGQPQLVEENVSSASISPDGHATALLRSDLTGRQPLSLWIARNGQPARQFSAGPFSSRRYRTGYVRFSPDGSRLGVWLGNWNGKSEFWIVPFPGAPRQAFSLLQGTYAFSWMPDNRHIVFGGVMPGMVGADLHMADTRTGDVRPITVTSEEAVLPSVSPDGGKIAFTVARDDSDLVEVPLDGSPVRTLLSTSRNESDPSWSPNGTQFAYSTDRTGTGEIWLKSAAEGWERPLITEKDFGRAWIMSLSETSFSPDGQRIAYSVVGSNGHSVYISNVLGGPPLRLTSDDADQRSPSWNPDGNWIAYLQNVEGRWALAKAATGGGQKPVILRDGCLPFHPKWSKRGDWISCFTNDGLTLISPDGATSKTVSKDIWLVHGWSADGKMIYGIKSVDNRGVLASIDVDKGIEKVIADLKLSPGAAVGCFSLSPGGKGFATSIGRTHADIWLLQGFVDSRNLWQRLWKSRFR